MHGSLHMEHDFKGEYIQKHFKGQFTENLGGPQPTSMPSPLHALGQIIVVQDKKKKCITSFGRTFASHGSENCSAVQTYKCNCVLRCFNSCSTQMLYTGYKGHVSTRNLFFYVVGWNRCLCEVLVIAPAVAMQLLKTCYKSSALLLKVEIYWTSWNWCSDNMLSLQHRNMQQRVCSIVNENKKPEL